MRFFVLSSFPFVTKLFVLSSIANNSVDVNNLIKI